MPRRTINQRMKQARSQGGLSPVLRAQLDRFVEGLLLGIGSTQAAVFAGISSRAAARQAQRWRVDPYVRERFKLLAAKLERDAICSFAEQALDVKSMAFSECESTQDRLRAHKLLARLMGHEAPTKVSTTVNGGVLLLPVAESMEAWEKQAISAQAALQKEVEKDATL